MTSERLAVHRFALPVAIVAAALLLPRPAGTNVEQPQVIVNVPEQPAPIVNVTVPDAEPPTVSVTVPEQIPNVTVEISELPIPHVIVNTPEPPTRIVEVDVEVERIVEVPACLDYGDLPHFDLANAITAGFPGTLWGISNGLLTWRDEDVPEPSMAEIIGAWLTYLEKDC